MERRIFAVLAALAAIGYGACLWLMAIRASATGSAPADLRVLKVAALFLHLLVTGMFYGCFAFLCEDLWHRARATRTLAIPVGVSVAILLVVAWG